MAGSQDAAEAWQRVNRDEATRSISAAVSKLTSTSDLGPLHCAPILNTRTLWCTTRTSTSHARERHPCLLIQVPFQSTYAERLSEYLHRSAELVPHQGESQIYCPHASRNQRPMSQSTPSHTPSLRPTSRHSSAGAQPPPSSGDKDAAKRDQDLPSSARCHRCCERRIWHLRRAAPAGYAAPALSTLRCDGGGHRQVRRTAAAHAKSALQLQPRRGRFGEMR